MSLRKLHFVLQQALQRHPCWSWSGQWWWLQLHELLLHPAPTCPGAGPDLCTLHWCMVMPSINWCKYSTCTHVGHHPLQLALVVFFLPATGAHTPLALMQLALCAIYTRTFKHVCTEKCLISYGHHPYIGSTTSNFQDDTVGHRHAGCTCNQIVHPSPGSLARQTVTQPQFIIYSA